MELDPVDMFCLKQKVIKEQSITIEESYYDH